MKYGKARELIAEARKTFAQRSASLIGRMGGSPEEVRQGITGKRTPAAKSGRALLTKAHKAAEKKRKRDPDYPYGKAETRRMSKYMSEAQLDELSDAKMRGYVMKSAYNAAVDAPTHGVKKRLKGIGTALKKMAGYRKVNEARRMRSRPGVVADRVQKIQDKFEADMKTGKATEDMLKRIANHHADAWKKYNVERANAKTHVENKIRHAHHTMRAKHYKTHTRNYERHYANAKKAHDAGDYRRAWAEGSHASSGPHLRDVPSHVDYHIAGYEDKK